MCHRILVHGLQSNRLENFRNQYRRAFVGLLLGIGGRHNGRSSDRREIEEIEVRYRKINNQTKLAFSYSHSLVYQLRPNAYDQEHRENETNRDEQNVVPRPIRADEDLARYGREDVRSEME